MSDVIVAPSTRDLEDLRRDLESWLQSQMPGAANIRVDNLEYPRGAGQSHETILFDAHWDEGGAHVDQGCVVRFKPTSFIMFQDDLFYEQIRVMQIIHADGRVPVAKVLWVERDPSVLGGEFYVMEKKIGRVPVSVPPYSTSGWFFESTPEQRRRAWQQGVEALARIHTFPIETFDFLKEKLGPETGLAAEWDKYRRYIAFINADGGEVPMLTEAMDKLEKAWPVNDPGGIVWGDSRIGNMMFDANYDLIAVMDWEQPSLGGSLNDLAWWISLGEQMHGANGYGGKHLEGMGTRQETVDIWESITGMSAKDLEWYEDFTQLKTACMSIRMGRLRGQGPLMDLDAVRKRLKLD